MSQNKWSTVNAYLPNKFGLFKYKCFSNFKKLESIYIVFTFSIFLIFSSCKETVPSNEIIPPILGRHQTKSIEGKDSIIYHQIPSFKMLNQYGNTFGSSDLNEKIYLTEFFFTSCPSVCPKVAVQMEQIHQDLQNISKFALVSFTLDSKRDTPEKLFAYAEKKEVNHSNWYFLNGEMELTYRLAEEGYYAAAYNDKTEEKDNIMHDGVLVLVDTNGHIRGMYDGMDKSTVAKVKQDVLFLLKDQD